MPPNDASPPPDSRKNAPAADVPAETPAPRVIVVPVAVVPVIVPVPVPVPAEKISCGAAESVPADFSPKARKNFPREIARNSAGQNAAAFPSAVENAAGAGVFSRAWRKIGGTGFAVSFFFHLAILIFAAWFVFAEAVAPKKEDAMFVSGSGGGRDGDSSRARRTRKISSDFEKKSERVRIVSFNKNAAIALSPLPEKIIGTANFAGRGADGFSGDESGAGTGSGGGIGAGPGLGVGNGRIPAAKFKTLLGAQIKAEKIAVYLDCSGSMQRYLPAVKAEIYEKFPDADVFAFSGAQTEVIDGAVVGGRNFKLKKNLPAPSRRRNVEDETEVSRLSPQGRTIYKKYSAHFLAGTAGAWLDILSRERYDALVVFSDFRDGVRQRRGDKTIFADSAYAPAPDGRNARERRWESDWIAAFSRKGAPRLYLFSVKARPQEFLLKCVSASDGESSQLALKKEKSAKK